MLSAIVLFQDVRSCSTYAIQYSERNVKIERAKRGNGDAVRYFSYSRLLAIYSRPTLFDPPRFTRINFCYFFAIEIIVMIIKEDKRKLYGGDISFRYDFIYFLPSRFRKILHINVVAKVYRRYT